MEATIKTIEARYSIGYEILIRHLRTRMYGGVVVAVSHGGGYPSSPVSTQFVNGIGFDARRFEYTGKSIVYHI
jgi:hypothetical protein